MSALSSQLVTVSDRVFLLSELDNVQRSFFSALGSKDLNVLGIRASSMDFWNDLLASNHQDARSLENLRQQIASYHIVRVQLAIEPDRSLLERIAAQFRRSLGDECLVSYELDPKMGAGIVYTLEGKIVDRSLESKLHELDLKSILAAALPILSS